ncbi:D-glycero-beta-D-manno-heptose 1-phosphate adenylyltransferase [Thermodesulfatator autotrophicus]|uniref:D-glycero-beta-D-manno-heptose 1-phosphate adenylyltransferase n=1 Tax=Thermodesulfatator autotrophicus TaxID=1795632 RepID=A0A177E867_9BACT|nr:glycerol-3-phosphate cytidylyltransferase [Thermodesulfatator autotrophicus]
MLPLEELCRRAGWRKALGQKMVFTNGCFDLLHAGHVSYLARAREAGDFLVVGLNSDTSIRRIKGPKRPVNPQEYRAQVLGALSVVDYVVLFDEDTPERLIKALRPDVLVKGADWPEEKIVGASFVKSYGGKVLRIPFEHEISTTKIIEKIRQNEA